MKRFLAFLLSASILTGIVSSVYAGEADSIDKKYDGRYMHISFDDVYACISDISSNDYSSVFENSFLNDLKEFHDNYGAVFTLNCFNTETTHTDYDIANLSDKYAPELAQNSDWLKFSFHAENEQSNYGDGSNGTNTSGQITGDAPEEIKASYNKFTSAILNATGTENAIDTVVRLGYFAGTNANVKALKECDYGITGLLAADDNRISYYLDSTSNSKLISKGRYYDAKNDITLLRTQKRLENVSDAVSDVSNIPVEQNIIEVFTHEQNYNSKVRTNLTSYLEWAKENNIEFAYAKDILAYEKENPAIPETGIACTLYPNERTSDNADASIVNTQTTLDPPYRGKSNSSAKKPSIALNSYSEAKGRIIFEFDLTLNLADYVFWLQPQKDAGPNFGFQASSDITEIIMPEGLTETNCLLTKIPFKEFGSAENKHHIKIELFLDDDGMINADISRTKITVDNTSSGELPSYGTLTVTNFTYFARRYDNPSGSAVKTAYDKDNNIYHFDVTDFSATYIPDEGVEKDIIDTSNINIGGNVNKFMVYCIKTDKVSRQYEVAAADEIKVTSAQDETVEIVPIYEYNGTQYDTLLKNAKDGFELPDSFEAGERYNFIFKKANYSTSDMYINGAMTANNVDQWGFGRTRTEGAEFSVSDIKADLNGKFTVQAMDVNTNDADYGALSWIKIYKAPSINRKTKIYVIGDSLVCNYYGNGNQYLGSAQTGWGQQLNNFINNEYEVVNLGNSGYYAKNMYDTSFAGIKKHSETGDILLFEAGYNDYKYSTEAEMAEYAGKIIDEAKAAGLNVIAINPNAAPEELKPQVKFGQVMLDTAKSKNIQYIDLSEKTYNYITSLYGTDIEKLKSNLALSTAKDNCHSSYVGAMKYASLVANALYNLGYEALINTDFTYKINDTEGNEIVCNALIDADDAITDDTNGNKNTYIFGTSASTEDGVKVRTASLYTDTKGYGFENVDNLTVNADNVISTTAYKFKLKTGNGNYTVKMETSAESVISEILDVSNQSGITKTTPKEFQTAVIDGVLDITIPENASLGKIVIEKHTDKEKNIKPEIYTIGDSTSNIRNDELRTSACMSWGNAIEDGKAALPSNIGAYHNYGWAGSNTVRAYNLGRLEGVLLNIHPGDYVTINFGINGTKNGISDSSCYEAMIGYFIDSIKDRGGIPVALTHTPQQPSSSTYSNGVFSCSLNDKSSFRCPKLVAVAEKKGIDIIDVGTYGNNYFNSLPTDTAYETAKSWYYDELHYKQPLGMVLAEYILDEISKKIDKPTPDPTTPPTTDPSKKENRITYFDEETITAEVIDKDAVLYTASYENGALKSIEVNTFDETGEKTFELKTKADKAFLWSKNMEPYDMKELMKQLMKQTDTESSEISLDHTSYPLYTGVSNKSTFSNWQTSGSSVTITADVHNGKNSVSDVIWTIADDTVATLTTNSKNQATVKGLRTGYTTITATLPNGEAAKCSISVIDNAARLTTQRIELNTDRLKLSEGQSAALKPIFYPKDIYNLGILNTSLSWQSSDTAVATVNENGVVTAVGSGAAKITATSADMGRTAQCDITVTNGIVQNEITADDKITDMTVGEQVALKSKTDGEIIWKSDNSYIADVDKQGVVTAYSNSNVQNVSADGLTVTETAGTVKVYATAVNGGKTAEYEISVASSDIADKYLVPSDGVFGKTEYSVSNKTTDLSVENTKEIDIDEVNQIKATSNGDSRILWINTNQNIATLDREGNVQGYNTGTVKLYAVTEDSLTAEQIKAVKALQENRENADEDILATISGAVYDKCEVTVKNSSPYLRNVHIPTETVTDNSVNILWNRAALNNISDFKEYKVYVNDKLLDTVTTLGYTVNNLNAETEYEFKITAVNTDGNDIISETIRVETKPVPTKVLNVLDYGARGDGTTMDTYAIQKAINDCPENGMVYLPSGYVFYSGALFLKSNMTFKVDGIVIGSIDPKDYPRWVTKWEGWRKTEQTSNEWANTTSALPNNHKPHSSLINAGKYDEGVYGMTGPYNVENLVICGKGQINANGFALGFNEGPNKTYETDWTSYPYPVKDPMQRGRAVTVHNGRNIYIKDVTIAYSPSWTTHLIYCDSVTVDNAQIVSQGNGNGGKGTSVKNAAHIPNGDGIDPESCTNLNVFNTRMSTGDDSFTMKSGRNREGNELDKPNAYIRVTDCTTAFSLGGYGYGSENAAGAHDVLFQNITVDTVAMYGFWFKTNKARGGISENIQVRDSYVTGANSAVYANHTYVSATTNAASSLPVLRYMTFENVNGGSNSNGFKFEGLKGSDIYGVKIIGGSMNNKPSSVKYGRDFTILDCEDTEWSCENSSNIDILSTAMIEDTKLSVKTGAYKIKEIDNEIHVIYAYKGTSADEVLTGIDSLLGGKQTYQISDNSITVVSQNGEHSAMYIIDLSSDIPTDGYINSLSIKSGDRELLKNFNRDITEYTIKSAKESSVTVTAHTNDINASVNITNNGAEFDGSLTDGINELKITVTSSDNSDTKIYTVTIDNSYIIAEDFSSVTDDKWGFLGENNASISATEVNNANDVESETLKLLTSNKGGSSLTKVFSDDISSLKKADVQFDWKSNMNDSKGRWGYFALQDSEGNYIFSIYANDKNGIGYAMIDPTADSAIKNIAKFSRTWYTVSLSLNFENGTVKGTIKERDTGKTMVNIDGDINASNLSKMYAYDGYSATPMSIDNVYIKQGDFNND